MRRAAGRGRRPARAGRNPHARDVDRRDASAEHFLGRHKVAERRLAAALETLLERDSAEAVTVLLARIAGAFFTLDVTAGCVLSEEALAIASASATRC